MPAPVSHPDDDNATFALSYLALRRFLGLLGFALPVILLLGRAQIDVTDYQTSISAHYYAPTLGDVFVGSLAAIGVFLMYYKGFPNGADAYRHPFLLTPLGRWLDRHLTDARVTTAAGIGALGTALVPTCLDDGIIPLKAATCSAGVHFGFAGLFFLSLVYMSLFQFTRSRHPRESWDTEKRLSNTIHVACGYAMAGCLVLIGVDFAVGGLPFPPHPVFVLETLAVWAFALSWLVKGDTLQGMQRALGMARG